MIKRMSVLFVVMVLFSGCASTSKTAKAEPDPMLNHRTYFDVANDFMIEVSGFWPFGMGTVDYVGDKTEETTRYIGDIYQSL